MPFFTTLVQAISNEAATQNTARAALQADVEADIADLQAADIAINTVVSNNGDSLAGVIELTDAHAEQMQTQKQNITSVLQSLASQEIDIMSLESEMDTETGNLLTALNSQIVKQETDRAGMQQEITDNHDHFMTMDDTLNAALLQTKSDLTDEVMAGAVRDERLDAHDEKFTEVMADVDGNNDLILLTQQELNDKFNFLANYTDHSVQAMGDQMESNMNTFEEEQNAANDALAAMDAAIMVSLNQTQHDLDDEEMRGDDQDMMLAAHGDELVALATDIATNVDEIETVQSNLDHEVEVMEMKMNLTEIQLQSNIDQLESDVNMVDQDLQNQLDSTNMFLNDTRTDLAAEIARGDVRDTRLDGHDDDVHDINDDIEDINEELDDTMAAMKANDTRLQDEIDSNYDDLTMQLNDLGDELRAMDAELNNTDHQIMADLADTNVALDEEVARGEGAELKLFIPRVLTPRLSQFIHTQGLIGKLIFQAFEVVRACDNFCSRKVQKTRCGKLISK